MPLRASVFRFGIHDFLSQGLVVLGLGALESRVSGL